MTAFISQLEWRYATKAFDPTRKVAPADLEKIMHSIRMAPTSFGLQPFRVVVIDDQNTKDRIFEIGWKQPQFKTASSLLAFIALTDARQRITDFLHLLSEGDAAKLGGLKAYESMMRGALEGRSPDDLKVWAQKQVYIALGFAMAACSELHIDSCPMEGFSPPEADKILGVAPGEFTTVFLPIGYRAPNETPRPKARFKKETLFSKI